VVSNVSSFSSDIIIVAAKGQSVPRLAGYPTFRVVTDTYPGKGPLGGIYTGLSIADSFYSLVVASDMPFLNEALLRYMIKLSADFDLVALRLGDLVEPLHAVYSKDCLAPIQGLLRQGNLKVLDLLPRVRVRYVEAEEIERFDPEHLSFFNVNTEADLQKAKEILEGNIVDDKR
jgi:molybdopterin-guanine dinucleotide biosynthesis protein A